MRRADTVPAVDRTEIVANTALLLVLAGVGTIAAPHIRVGRTGNRGASSHGGAGDTSRSAGRNTHHVVRPIIGYKVLVSDRGRNAAIFGEVMAKFEVEHDDPDSIRRTRPRRRGLPNPALHPGNPARARHPG
ncbi:hypothetical protein ACFWAY_37055 [Rhodococcus sp. NPDC059968]|uniref:hypothetical protein n=1 Tax=Rhodococcus sp. NPDC059968 TaxID=3347017 RepID=UPI0036723E28